MKAGIGIDPYKLETFKKELTDNGFSYTIGKLSNHVLMLFIEFDEKDFNKVKKLIRHINLKSKSNKDQN